ncbi:TPA: hypothetical protein LA460_000074 [Clostridium botulinum]|nr:hypothetical protein [Clostridium botulinum]HBJ1652679.1 hypothetical protein [Clostridium botulinum]
MMDIKYLEKEFTKMYKGLYGDSEELGFYVPTVEHSSGFNKVELWKDEDEYSVTEEDECCIDEYLKFEEIIKRYPYITLDREYAFHSNFVTWEDIEQALKGNKEIDLVRL